MDGLIHPMGDEAPQTYWVRRAVVVAVLVLLLVVVGMLVNGLSSASGQRPNAQPAPVPEATATAAPTSSGPASADPTPGPAAPSGGSTPAPSGTPTPAAASAQPSSTPSAQTSLKPGPGTFVPEPPPGAPRQAPAPGAATICDGSAVRVEITGPAKIKAGAPVRHQIKATNTSGRDCRLEINPSTFELKIYSGTDRISSTNDCTMVLLPRTAQLASGHYLEWQVEWQGNRSAPGCRTNPEQLRPGTYVATAQLKGAKPAQSVMQLA